MRWVMVVGVGAGLLLGAAFLFDVSHECGRHHRFTTLSFSRGFCRAGERPARSTLKTLASAQADFRANDRDLDHQENFWRADIAGLYALAPGESPAIKLIELSLAAADDRPVVDLSAYAVRSQKGGYWYRALRHADEDPKALDPNRYAACAFPDSPSAGKYLYLIDESNTIWRSVANGRRGVDVFPTAEELRMSWSKVD